MITIEQSGSFKGTQSLLERILHTGLTRKLHAYGEVGAAALAKATPKDTGKTAASWSYEITQSRDSSSIVWTNSNIEDGVPVAVVLQYGHAMPNGGYMHGIDYINPALAPIFNSIAEAEWEDVIKG